MKYFLKSCFLKLWSILFNFIVKKIDILKSLVKWESEMVFY